MFGVLFWTMQSHQVRDFMILEVLDGLDLRLNSMALSIKCLISLFRTSMRTHRVGLRNALCSDLGPRPEPVANG